MPELVVLGNPSPIRPPATIGTTEPRFHLLPGDPALVFVVEGSRLFAVEPSLFEALAKGDLEAELLLLGKHFATEDDAEGQALGAPTALSLNVAQSCNLSCGYCYAGEGRFGGTAAMMSRETAQTAVRRLIESAPGQTVTVGFIGGEPFLNREVIHSTVAYAESVGRSSGSRVRFSVTTNATLLTEADLRLLRDHSFVVSVSLDGGREVNDQSRRSFAGSSFERAITSLAPLLADSGGARINARATVTRRDLRIAERLESLAAAGFSEVGVSPVRSSPDPGLVLQSQDWPRYLVEMIRAAEGQRERLLQHKSVTFSNLGIALKQLHAGYCKPLPCGSAATYLSVSATGEYFSCHRTIGNPRMKMGSLQSGLLTQRRESFLRNRHVDLQEPCRGCWARYLCGGGCHAEVLTQGRSGCDFIRGWLEYCIRFYDFVLTHCPEALPQGGPQ